MGAYVRVIPGRPHGKDTRETDLPASLQGPLQSSESHSTGMKLVLFVTLFLSVPSSLPLE